MFTTRNKYGQKTKGFSQRKNQTDRKKKRISDPLPFICFLLMWVALACFLVVAFMHNVQPYYKVFSERYGNQQQAYLFAVVFCVITQGFQVAYWLITRSKAGMKSIIEDDKQHQKYEVDYNDSAILYFAKIRYNSIPSDVLAFFQWACIASYTFECIVSLAYYPLISGFSIFATFKPENIFWLGITLFAFETICYCLNNVTKALLHMSKND